MSPPLKDQVAVVTGATGGIGRAVALELAAGGARIVVHTHQAREAAQQLVEQIRGVGSEATAIVADLSVATQRRSFIDQAWNWQSAVDILVNVAGADVLTGDAAQWTYEQKLEALWHVDVLATIELSRAMGQKMKARGWGAIVNVGWDQAEQGMAGDSGELFAAIKGAVMCFSRSLAQSLAPQVRVNCVAPGWIHTAWAEQASDYWQQRAQRQALCGRWGRPEDIAKAVLFLASPAAEFINGQVISVNGGFRYE